MIIASFPKSQLFSWTIIVAKALQKEETDLKALISEPFLHNC